MNFIYRSILALLIAVMVMAAPRLNAQDAEPRATGSLLDEIVVTAQRREERSQEVPIALSVFSDAQLEQLNITQTLGLVKLIPNLLGFNNTGLGTANGYYLRGIGNTESIATFDPPVGTYVDDVFISRQNANNLGLFDVERIEVLRGPQGTLFGRNTTGGAMNLVLRKPAGEFGGYLETGFGQFSERFYRGSVDIPFSETVLSKLSGYYNKNDGYVSNPVTGENDLNASESLGARAALRFLFSDSVTWDVALQYTEDQGANLLNFVSGSGGQAYLNGATTNPLVSIPATGPQVELLPQRPGLPPTSTTAQSIEARCTGSITRSRFLCSGLRQTGTPLAGLLTGDKRNYNLGNKVENVMVTSNLQWDAGFGQLDFITGYVSLKQKFALDFFNGTAVNTAMGPALTNPAGGFTIANDGTHKQISQEVKLTGELNDRVRYVAGLYYFDEKNDTDYGDLFSLSPTLTLVLEDRILKNEAKAWAVFSQWDLKLADAFTVTVGGRYTDETKEIDFIANPNPNLAPPTAPTRVNSANLLAAGIPLSQTTKLFTPRVALKYDVNNDVNVFLSATRGFKSGGWNARGTAPVANQPFEPEKVWSYEAGLRSDWLDRRLRANLTVFKLDVADLQTPSAFTAPSGAISFITRNFSGFDNQGIEAELIYSPIDPLTLYAFIGLQDAKYKDIDPTITAQAAACQAAIAAMGSTANLCGSGIVNNLGEIADPVRAPDTYTLGGSYRFNFGSSLTLTPNVSWARTGDNNVGTNGAPSGLVDAYDTLDAGLTLANVNEGWQIRANCRNCTDEIQIVSVLSDLAYIQPPRTWSLTFKLDFGARK